MIYFIYGEDSYRSKKKLEDIILGYKEKNRSGINLVYFDTIAETFKNFFGNLQVNSMFAEKKLIILKNVFESKEFQTNFLENIQNLEKAEDIVIVYQDNSPDQRTKLFKELQKKSKCQEFGFLSTVALKKWIVEEFVRPASKHSEAKINPEAVDLLISFVGSDLWRMSNEINKLSNYKKNSVIKKEDVALLVKPGIDNDIFKTIESLVSGEKKQALTLLHKHLEDGDNALYLLSMIAYQFRNILIIKELQEEQTPYNLVAKKSGLHPFVVQKSYYLCNQFSIEKLKKIYRKIFQVDSDIKTGKIEAEIALDLLLSEI